MTGCTSERALRNGGICLRHLYFSSREESSGFPVNADGKQSFRDEMDVKSQAPYLSLQLYCCLRVFTAILQVPAVFDNVKFHVIIILN